jgi:hypothetical protein
MLCHYEQNGRLVKVGRTEDDNYLRNQGEDYHVMYDNRGRIKWVLYPGDDNQPVMRVEYQYTDGGQIAKIIARDLTKGTPTDIYCMEYEYDENGRKTGMVTKQKESDANTSAYYVVNYGYDSRDMLTEEKYVRWNSGTSKWDVMYWARYKYDTAGNMVYRLVEQIVNGNAKAYEDSQFTYSRGYQLTGFTRSSAVTPIESRNFTLTYDANGNMTHISQNATFTDSFYDITEIEFQFDEKNRMTKYRFGGSGSWYEIKYDSLGRVRERVDLTPTTTKYYSDGRQLIQQLDSSDNVEFDYFRGPTGLMRQWEENGTPTKRFYIKDNLDTVWALVDPSTLTVKRYNYNAWGEHLDKDDTDFPTDINFMRYIGCRVEAFGDSTAQTDVVYHLDHRHYLPSTGFINREPLTLGEWAYSSYALDGYFKPTVEPNPNDVLTQAFVLNPPMRQRIELRHLPWTLISYLYANGDPVNKVDHSGLTGCCKNRYPDPHWPISIFTVGLIHFSPTALCVWRCVVTRYLWECEYMDVDPLPWWWCWHSPGHFCNWKFAPKKHPTIPPQFYPPEPSPEGRWYSIWYIPKWEEPFSNENWDARYTQAREWESGAQEDYWFTTFEAECELLEAKGHVSGPWGTAEDCSWEIGNRGPGELARGGDFSFCWNYPCYCPCTTPPPPW